MEIRRRKNPFTFIILFTTFLILVSQYWCSETTELTTIQVDQLVHVGLTLDMQSREGKIISTCINLAISDFYNLHDSYITRLVIHSKDSKGETLQAVTSALELLDEVKVEAIIGGQTRMEAKLLADLVDRAKVPLISLSQLSFSPNSKELYPFFVQITQDETLQFKGMSTVVQAFKWRDVIVISEDSAFGIDSHSTLHLIDSLEQNNIIVTHKIVIATSYTNEKIVEQLRKLMTLQSSTVFIVHMSSNDLVSRFFEISNRLGMMSEGYVWFMTATTLNHLHDCVDTELIQGVIGLKPYIPPSKQLQNFNSRLRRKLYIENPDMELLEYTSAYGIWAYDSIWVLAEAAERARFKLKFSYGSQFLDEILQTRFMGLSGEVQFIDKKLQSTKLEIVNVIEKAQRPVGVWTNERRKLLSSPNDLERIIWPGGSINIPKGRSMRTIKLRLGVPVKKGFRELVKVESDPNSNGTKITGFCVDVFKAVVKNLTHVQYEFIPFENATGRYDELVDQVYFQNYNGIVGDTTITENRSNYVDFTLPFTDLGVGMMVKNEIENTWIFLKPFSANLWITTGCFFILTGLIVWIIERSINQEFQGTTSQQVGTIFWYSFSTIVFAQREKLQNNLSKFVVIVWVFAVLILTSSYTATLTSMMTVRRIELNTKGNYVGYQWNLFSLSGFSNHFNFKGGRLYNSPQAFAEALSKGSKHGGVSTIVAELPYIKIFLANYPDDYSMVKSKSSTNGFGFVFTKGSPWVQDMSREIAKLRQSGELEKLEEFWFNSSESTNTPQDLENDPSVLNVTKFRGLFYITGTASAFALILFIIFALKENWHLVKKFLRIHFLGVIRKYFLPKVFHVNRETEIVRIP